jgi:coenzyme F420-reducing hydrogenase alpha subunit
MTRTIQIDPVTRIEGHARIEVDIDDARHVTRSLFKVMDFRGFETFLKGMQVEMLPTVTSRICGTCPQAHHLAAARTVDKVFNATPPPAALLLRQALNMGSILHSHGVHFFALAGPDILLPPDVDPAERNIVGMLKSMPEVARKALRLRTIGQQVCEIIGGRGTHPVASVAGGMAAPLGKEKYETLSNLVREAPPLGMELTKIAREALIAGKDRFDSLPLQTYYLGTVKDEAMDFYEGNLRLLSPEGKSIEFSEDHYAEYLHEETTAESYAKRVFCKNADGEAVAYRVGPLARINCTNRMDTPIANEELQRFRELAGSPCHKTLMYHYARLIEMVYAIEMLVRIVHTPEILSDNVQTIPKDKPRNATAHVESPRGILIHDYEVDPQGIVQRANLIVATQQNIAAINDTIALSAEKYLDAKDEILLNGIEFGIRCYDPCLSCATHRIGELKLEVVVRQNGKAVRTVRR